MLTGELKWPTQR